MMTKVFIVLMLVYGVTTFPLKCPEPAQWSIRARGLCPNQSKYSCLKNDLIDGYSENCTIFDFQQPGRKGVLRGGLDADICSQERYHPWPIKYYTNASTNCIFLKSMCNEEGQVVYDKGNRNKDITCRCDYTRGYSFLTKPRQPCFCVPSEEECSCYLKTCIDHTYYLSPDYECIYEKMNTNTVKCQAIKRERVNTERNDRSSEDTTRTENIRTIVQRESYTRIIVITFCIVIILVYCIHELMGKKHCKATTPTKDPRTLIIHTTEEDDLQYKAFVRLGDDVKGLTLTDLFDKKAQQSPRVELEKDIDGQKIQVKHQKRDRSNVPDLMITKLEQWEKEDAYFVDTRASKYVIDCLWNNKCVSVVGPPGVGKTFLVKHVALQMEQNGFTICQVGSSKDIRDSYKRNRKTLFVVDDFCSHFTANASKLDEWKGSMNDIKDLLDTESNKLILTCRLQVFQDKCFDHLDFKLFKDCICNMVDIKLALTDSEKENLASKYCKNIDRNEIRHLFRFEFFPLLCKLYDSKQSSSEFCIGTFVKDPFGFYTEELCTLYNDSLEGKYKVCALLLLVLCNNHLERNVLKGSDEKVDSLIVDILANCNIADRLTATGKSLLLQFDALKGTYLAMENDVYHAIHDKMFDFLTYYFGTNDNFAELLIKRADWSIISERFIILPYGEYGDIKCNEYTIPVQDENNLQLYIERVFDDMAEPNKTCIWNNKNNCKTRFYKALSSYIKNLKKEKISHLIQTASDEFVRDIFVMDEHDINSNSSELYERYGIILDKDHLQKYIERVFNDMSKSDCVRMYFTHCRCLSNEAGRINFSNYLAKLSSTRIVDLIQNATTWFVNLMFVMEEHDIRLNSPHAYARYGIVVPVDAIHLYIKRVFDDMKEYYDVNIYLKDIRNNRNTKFYTELRHYMTELDMVTIKLLVKNASRSFIFQLCVMTIGEINEKSHRECERYGVIVPDELIPLYVYRWFWEMTESDDISKYFEENRNRQADKFKNELRRYMSELQETDILHLIQTAGADVLHKLFVMTEKDIKNDSIREFEHYGIVLQEKYMDMYTEKILNFENFIENIKYNRTIRSVLTCMSQLDTSKIAELIDSSNENIFHQMIAVDIDNELRLDKVIYSDLRCPDSDSIDDDMLAMREGLITCPPSLINQYMNRMILDWSKGKLNAVFENNNLKKKAFVDKFVCHLKELESSKISELVNIKKDDVDCFTTLEIICYQGEVNLAKWCLENLLHENPPEQKNNRLCALLLLVVFSNQLKETKLNDQLIKTIDVNFSLREMFNIEENISARKVKEELNTSLQKIGVVKSKDVYSVRHSKVFKFLVFYFASILQMSKKLVEYADEKIMYKYFLVENSRTQQTYFNISLAGEEFLTCTNRIFNKMKYSDEFIRYILRKDYTTKVNLIAANIRKLDVKEILENASIDFINKFAVISAKETHAQSDKESNFSIVIPDELIQIYIQRIFDNMAKNECVEACFQDNRNFKKGDFHTTFLTYMRELKENEVECLINEASSDFISRMFVMSGDDVKTETCWEYERCGIVIPKALSKMYVERVFSDMIKSVYLPVNRNTSNKRFRDILHSYTNSLSDSELASLIQTAGSEFISRIYLSSSEEATHISIPRFESSCMVVPEKCFQICEQMLIVKGKVKYVFPFSFSIKIDSTSYTITRPKYGNSVLITISRQNETKNSNLKQHLIKYIDPLFIGKRIEFHVKTTNDLVSKYIQRLLDDWSNGHVHDVFGNINLSNQSFRRKFLTHLGTIDHAKQTILATKKDNYLRNSPLVVCSYFGIKELADWLLDNTEYTQDYVYHLNNLLCIACIQNHLDIVSSLLNHKNKTDVNKKFGFIKSITPLYAACAGGYASIVSLLLEENVDVNGGWNTEIPLYAACKHGYSKIVSMLLDHKSNKIDINKVKTFSMKNNTPLYIACKKGRTQIVSLLLHHTADEVDVNKDTSKGETPLYASCNGGYTDIVDLLLARENREINKCRIDGASPLWVACQEGHGKVVLSLLNHIDIEIDKCILIGISPLFIASLLGHTEIVETLLNKKADATICVKKKEIVMQVAEKLRTEYINALNTQDYIGYIRKLVREKASEDVKSFIDGKEKDWVFNSILGASPLHMSSLMGHTDIVKLLVGRNSNINSFSENGNTPLILAYELGHADIVQVLLANGADPS